VSGEQTSGPQAEDQRVERLGIEETGIQQPLRYCGAEPVRQFLMKEQILNWMHWRIGSQWSDVWWKKIYGRTLGCPLWDGQ